MQTVHYTSSYMHEDEQQMPLFGQVRAVADLSTSLGLECTFGATDFNCDPITDPLARPKLSDIVTMFDQGLFQALVIYDLGRLSLDQTPLLATVARLRRNGAHIFTVMGWNTRDGGMPNLTAAHDAGL